MMKTFTALFLLTCATLAAPARAAEVTATDVAKHLGIQFWKFEAASLPARYSVALLEVKDGEIAAQRVIGPVLFPDKADMVVAISTTSEGLLVATINVGGSGARVPESRRLKVGTSMRQLISSITPGSPTLLCGDYYQPDKGRLVITGKIQDVESGLALLVVEEK